MIGNHTIKALEFEKIVSLVAGFCMTPFGREEVAAICPMYDRELIEKRLREVTQLRGIIEFGISFPLVRMEDSRELLERSTIEGTFLDPEAFLVIDELTRISIELNKYDKENRKNWPDIDEYSAKSEPFPNFARK